MFFDVTTQRKAEVSISSMLSHFNIKRILTILPPVEFSIFSAHDIEVTKILVRKAHLLISSSHRFTIPSLHLSQSTHRHDTQSPFSPILQTSKYSIYSHIHTTCLNAICCTRLRSGGRLYNRHSSFMHFLVVCLVTIVYRTVCIATVLGYSHFLAYECSLYSTCQFPGLASGDKLTPTSIFATDASGGGGGDSYSIQAPLYNSRIIIAARIYHEFGSDTSNAIIP